MQPPPHNIKAPFPFLKSPLILALDHIYLEPTTTEFSLACVHTGPGSQSSVGSPSSLTPYMFIFFPMLSVMFPFYLELASLYGELGYLTCSGGRYQWQHFSELPAQQCFK